MGKIKKVAIDILLDILVKTKKAGQDKIDVNEIINVIRTLQNEQKGK